MSALTFLSHSVRCM